MKGKIKFFKADRGYGFIVTEKNQDIFFHITDFVEQPNPKMVVQDAEVEFEKGSGMSGEKAIKIKFIGEQE